MTIRQDDTQGSSSLSSSTRLLGGSISETTANYLRFLRESSATRVQADVDDGHGAVAPPPPSNEERVEAPPAVTATTSAEEESKPQPTKR